MMTYNSLFFHSPSSFMMEIVITMHDYVMLFLFSVLALVMMALTSNLYLKFFNMEFFENHQLEGVWTIIPFILLTFILIPSLNSLYMLDTCLMCGITLGISGHQWYWSYFYKDFFKMFDSYMVTGSTTLRLLEVDNRLSVPSLLPIRFLVSSVDVIHSWTVPSLGFKMDAVPGRVNQFCLSNKRSGIFFGQCSEICGANHSFMPIVLESLSFQDFIKIMI